MTFLAFRIIAGLLKSIVHQAQTAVDALDFESCEPAIKRCVDNCPPLHLQRVYSGTPL